jgi:3-methyladenine DNA glycosylase AlkC
MEDLANQISQFSIPLTQEIANYNTYRTKYTAISEELKEEKEKFYQLSGFFYDEVQAG